MCKFSFRIKNLKKSVPSENKLIPPHYSSFWKLKSWVTQHTRLYKIIRPIYIPSNLRILKKQIFKMIDKDTDKKKLMVDLGSAQTFRRHWKNLDFETKYHSLGYGAIDYNYNFTSHTLFPFNDNSVSFFFTSHALEHVQQKHIPFVFSEIFRCLKPYGVIRFVLPDFEIAVKAFLNNNFDYVYPSSHGPIEERFLHFFAKPLKKKFSAEKLHAMLTSMTIDEFANYFTNQISDDEIHEQGNVPHVNWYTYSKLEKLLKDVGFSKIYQSSLQGSEFKEMRGKLFDKNNPNYSFYVEAIK